MVLTGDEMTNKFTIGSQWTTKGGWRAVVVSIEDNLMLVWHSADDTTWVHSIRDGTPVAPGGDRFSLDKPYTEPRKGTVWVNVWRNREYDEIVSVAHDSEKEYLDELSEGIDYQRIASFKHDWTENEKL